MFTTVCIPILFLRCYFFFHFSLSLSLPLPLSIYLSLSSPFFNIDSFSGWRTRVIEFMFSRLRSWFMKFMKYRMSCVEGANKIYIEINSIRLTYLLTYLLLSSHLFSLSKNVTYRARASGIYRITNLHPISLPPPRPSPPLIITTRSLRKFSINVINIDRYIFYDYTRIIDK